MSRIDSNAIVQSFRVAVPDNVPGCFLTKIDLFFFRKSRTFGVEVYLMEVVNGLPDPAFIIGQSRVTLQPDQVNVSNDATAATTFVFPEPIYVEANKRYAFAVRPVNNNPDYQLWVGLNGATDVTTNRTVASTPLSESSYFAKQSSEFAEMMNEDVKFRLHRAKFVTGVAAEVTLQKDNTELFAVTDIALTQGTVALQPGDAVYALDNDVVQLNIRGSVVKHDALNGVLYLNRSTGGFQANTKLMFIREAIEGNPYSDESSWLGTGYLASILDFEYHSVVPKLGSLNLPLTQLKVDYRGAREVGGTFFPDTTALTIDNGTEHELSDTSRFVLSFSSERRAAALANTSSVSLQAAMISENDFLSPVIDLDHSAFVASRNDINATTADEETNYGKARCRYISRVITLADGMEAEDLRVLISAFRPPSSDVRVYAKVWNQADDDTFDEKLWTQMVEISATGASDPQNRDDFREYTFDMPSVAPIDPQSRLAFKNGNGVVTYRDFNGATHTTFKKYSIKVVMSVRTRSDGVNPPLLSDVRAIALQA